MPKQIIHPAEKESRIHPARLAYAKLTKQITETRQRIMQATGWSETTFYRKITKDARLTEKEAQAVATALQIPINNIDDFQHGYAN